jgi:site-specific DNA-cytosine methylase
MSVVALRSQSMINPILEQVRHRIDVEGISLAAASAAIGIGVSSMTRHIAGDYVRSDSLAKYRLWLQGGNVRQDHERVPFDKSNPPQSNNAPSQPLGFDSEPALPTRPRYVVDLFCGCGGMSLGFERFQGGAAYRVAMALDIEEPMVRVFNHNHPSPSDELPIARQTDITDFLNEAEIQLFYLDHLSRTLGNQDLVVELQQLGAHGVAGFRRTLHDLDEEFLNQLATVRSDSSFTDALRKLGAGTLGQTSVAGFHNAIKLPPTSSGPPKLGPLIWHGDGPTIDCVQLESRQLDESLIQDCRKRMRKLWDLEVGKLEARSDGLGHGQLASAADKIVRFLDFVESKPMRRIRDLWVHWRAIREVIRVSFVGDPQVQARLRTLYKNGHQVSVLLGGPPCQGFSRIGRGKIRSLREQSVHVHEDNNSVDSRNQLLHQYVLFISALAPDVFLFENVRHFQAVVKSDGIEFDAADILAESIRAVSTEGLGYAVARKIVIASQHAVPQARERFVMAGVREKKEGTISGAKAATWCLSLQTREAVSLQVALEGLPEPEYVKSNEKFDLLPVEPALSVKLPLKTSIDVFRTFVRCTHAVDSHIARPHRRDDRSFFALMGPGKRWMDYRCEDSSSLKRIASALGSIRQALARSPALAAKLGVDAEEIDQLYAISDGSLSLRLLLENIEPQPGEVQHHLLTETYLKKREGAHGDWLSRMDPSQPSKTIVSHMAKDTYAFVHPFSARTLSIREAARVQSFPDDYRFGSVGMVDGYKVVGNAVPPLLSLQFAERVAQVLALADPLRTVNSKQEIKTLAQFA